MLAAWPADLPEYLQEGASETLPSEKVETNSANGKNTARRRVRGKTRDFDGMVFCPKEKLARFEHFYRDELKDGVLPFTWVHPRTRAPGVFKFKGAQPQQMPKGSGAVVLISFKMVQVR